MILILAACIPVVKESVPSTDPPDDSDAAETYSLYLATTDYQVGSLAVYDVARDGMSDSVLLTAADNAVSASGDTLFVLGRSSEDTVRLYGDDLTAPTAEFSTGSATNPQSATLCNDTVVVALYGTDYLGLYKKDGSAAGTVDLSAFDRGGAGPKPFNLYVAPDGFLYVSLNHLDTSFRADGPGQILKVDCGSWTVAQSWDTTPDASFTVDPLHPERLVISGGNYFKADYSAPDLDGWLQTLDTSTGTLSDPLLTEADLGKNIGFVSLQDDGSMVVVTNDGYAWTVQCRAADGTWTTALSGNLYVAGGMEGPDGRIWMDLRPGFGDGTAVEGLVSVDPVACHVDAPRTTALPPSGLAWR
jgi:hypothetical protein